LNKVQKKLQEVSKTSCGVARRVQVKSGESRIPPRLVPQPMFAALK
jgi:hypothetical protein